MRFKMSTQTEKFFVFCGANWVKTTFFRCEFFIEISFLNKNWTQKLSFWKKKFLQKMIIRKVLFSITFGTIDSQFKIWLVEKFSIQSLIFKEKACFKIMPFNRSTKSEKLLFSAEHIESQGFHWDVKFSTKSDFWMKIELKNWVSKIYFFSKIQLFEKLCLWNLPGRKTFNSKPDILEYFLFKISLCRKAFASESHSFLSREISFRTLIFN